MRHVGIRPVRAYEKSVGLVVQPEMRHLRLRNDGRYIMTIFIEDGGVLCPVTAPCHRDRLNATDETAIHLATYRSGKFFFAVVVIVLHKYAQKHCRRQV